MKGLTAGTFWCFFLIVLLTVLGFVQARSLASHKRALEVLSVRLTEAEFQLKKQDDHDHSLLFAQRSMKSRLETLESSAGENRGFLGSAGDGGCPGSRCLYPVAVPSGAEPLYVDIDPRTGQRSGGEK